MTAVGPRPSARDRALEFTLPPQLEARVPPEARGLQRDEVRLMASFRHGDRVVHASFVDLPWFLDAGDLLVVNDSETIPAALTARTDAGAAFALHLSTRLDETMWVVEPRGDTGPLDTGVVAAGDVLHLPGGASVRMIAPHRGSTRLWDARVALGAPWLAFLRAHGRPIAYRYADGSWPIEAYQTVYARRPGSAEMPSAGRAFSARVLHALARRGVMVRAITLHTGVASLEADEPPYEEWFDVPAATASAMNAARARGGRVIAVGTTVVRALESVADAGGIVREGSGWTNLVITPTRAVSSVNGLLTGFHEPRASHLQMLAAIAPTEHLDVAYRQALACGYLWHEFGDLHLIL